MAPRSVSVIVSVYQQAASLRRLLSCLHEQDVAVPYEVIVTDDGSAPDVLTALADGAWASQMDVRYVWQPDRGFRLARARNNGIRQAQGDVIVVLDGDQIVARDFLTRHVNAHRGARCLVAGPVISGPGDVTRGCACWEAT
jgi:glycosyltransferase involved in cell wall biosynthesis